MGHPKQPGQDADAHHRVTLKALSLSRENATLRDRIAELEAAVKASDAIRALRVAGVEDERDAALVRVGEIEGERDNAQAGWDGCCLHRKELKARIAELEGTNSELGEIAQTATESLVRSSGTNESLRALLADAEAALWRLLESSACENGCAPDDMTCDTNYARAVLARIREHTTPAREEKT